MGMKSFTKGFIRKGFNVKKWVDYDYVKVTGKSVAGIAKDLYGSQAQAPQHQETFEQAVQRMGLTEKDIKKRMQTAQRISLGCGMSIFPVTLYAIYLMMTGSWLSSLVAVMMVLLLGAYAFRESFNLYQMKQRRLGCTVQAWFKGTFLQR